MIHMVVITTLHFCIMPAWFPVSGLDHEACWLLGFCCRPASQSVFDDEECLSVDSVVWSVLCGLYSALHRFTSTSHPEDLVISSSLGGWMNIATLCGLVSFRPTLTYFKRFHAKARHITCEVFLFPGFFLFFIIGIDCAWICDFRLDYIGEKQNKITLSVVFIGVMPSYVNMFFFVVSLITPRIFQKSFNIQICIFVCCRKQYQHYIQNTWRKSQNPLLDRPLKVIWCMRSAWCYCAVLHEMGAWFVSSIAFHIFNSCPFTVGCVMKRGTFQLIS